MKQKNAIVLVSGGLDSATVLALAGEQGFRLHAMSFQYGQRHHLEIEAAQKIARHSGVAEHRIVEIDLRSFGGSALTSREEIPKDRSLTEMAGAIPSTYVPARNTIFLAYSLAWAEVLRVSDIFIGVNAVDYSGYPDCRPEFIKAFEAMANLATKAGVEGAGIHIHAPLLYLGKSQIIQTGIRLGVDYSLTLSCYDPDSAGNACGHCDSCLLRAKGFQEAGIPDPASAMATGRPNNQTAS